MERSVPVGATAVVMDPKTGAVVALAQRPTHNPNDTRKLKPVAIDQAVADVLSQDRYSNPSLLQPLWKRTWSIGGNAHRL